MIPIVTIIFSNGLVQPPTRYIYLHLPYIHLKPFVGRYTIHGAFGQPDTNQLGGVKVVSQFQWKATAKGMLIAKKKA